NKNTSSEPTVGGTLPVYGGGVAGVGAGSSGWSYESPPPVVDKNTIKTNNEWGRQAVKWALSQNYPANLADRAVRNYLGGQDLNGQEQALIGEILGALGEPPQLIPSQGDHNPTNPPISGEGGTNTQLNARVSQLWHHSALLQWDAVTGATKYILSNPDINKSWTYHGTLTKLGGIAYGVHTYLILTAYDKNGTVLDSQTIRITANSQGGTVDNQTPAQRPKLKQGQLQYRTVTVSHPTNLFSMAQHHLGNSEAWRHIWNLNRDTIGNPESMLEPGHPVKIPKS
ncbi:MAG: hypothetical protein ACRDMV_01485, partial [Streptosporangiales bacterium]